MAWLRITPKGFPEFTYFYTSPLGEALPIDSLPPLATWVPAHKLD